MERTVNKFIYWIPRILCIAFLLFLAMFSLDVVTPGATVKDVMIGLFMHNIPVFILLVLLIISWKYEIVGGIAFLLAGIVYIIFSAFRPGMPWYQVLVSSLLIAGPSFLIGILFLINWFQKRL